MTKIGGAVLGIVGGALGVVLGGLIILGSRQSETSLSGHPGLTLGLWFILAGGLAVLMTVAGRRQAVVRGLGLLVCVGIGAAGLMSMSSQKVHRGAALLVWMIAGIPMIAGAVLALRSAARHGEPPAAALPAESDAPQPPAETAAEPVAGVCSQCGAALPSAELTFCPNCGAERVGEQS
jgi:hypothetical protein